jgi:hypothetical protein
MLVKEDVMTIYGRKEAQFHALLILRINRQLSQKWKFAAFGNRISEIIVKTVKKNQTEVAK